MQNVELLYKITSNKYFCFVVSNFSYLAFLCFYYNYNFYNLEILFWEIILISLTFFVINSLLYLFLYKILKDYQKVFIVLILISTFFIQPFSLLQILLFIIFILLMLLILKKFVKKRLSYLVGILSFILIIFFTYNFLVSIYNVSFMMIKSKSFDNSISVKVSENTESPNIYYIHCDGMMGISAMNKYFDYDDTYLTDYFNKNNYYYNEKANLAIGHKTQRALVALYNPYYYDKFFKKYLKELEQSFIDNNKNPSFVVDYYELKDKRLNNELFNALSEKGYTVSAISEFDQYTSFYTDYFFDYYKYDEDFYLHVNEIDQSTYLYDKINNDYIDFELDINMEHFDNFLNRTIFSDVLDNFNFLDYSIIDNKDIDLSKYPYISNTDYWIARSILKDLDYNYKIDSNPKFTFVNFKLNHFPLSFDEKGNLLDEEEVENLDNYLGNYIYSTYLLVDILNFIKDMDSDAIIVVQGDHGIHTIKNNIIMDSFDTDIYGVQEIRNSVINAVYVPEKYRNGDEKYLGNPLNISRYIVNNFVGNNYKYID